MSSRQFYFVDLLKDCKDALDESGLSRQITTPEALAQFYTALILSDSLNGLRRAVLDVADATRNGGR